MQIKDIEQRTEAWHIARLGVLTGTDAKRLKGTPKVREGLFYDILAQRLSTEANPEESASDRGTRLEDDAIIAYEASKSLKVTRIGLAVRSDIKWVGNSPDGLINVDGKFIGAVECKCLSSANHLKAYLKQEIPDEYFDQGIHYFVVNDDLEYLDFVFYDPRISKIPYFTIRMTREQYKTEIEESLKLSREFVEEINNALEKIL